jgi:hypothetical protein
MATIRLATVMAAVVLLVGCSRSALPKEQDMMKLAEKDIRSVVLEQIPLRTSRSAAEQVLKTTIRRKWDVMDYDTVEYMSRLGFSAPVSSGDYYFRCDLAAVPSGAFATRMITAYLLFDSSDHLKDVMIRKWEDGI